MSKKFAQEIMDKCMKGDAQHRISEVIQMCLAEGAVTAAAAAAASTAAPIPPPEEVKPPKKSKKSEGASSGIF